MSSNISICCIEPLRLFLFWCQYPIFPCVGVKELMEEVDEVQDLGRRSKMANHDSLQVIHRSSETSSSTCCPSWLFEPNKGPHWSKTLWALCAVYSPHLPCNLRWACRRQRSLHRRWWHSQKIQPSLSKCPSPSAPWSGQIRLSLIWSGQVKKGRPLGRCVLHLLRPGLDWLGAVWSGWV